MGIGARRRLLAVAGCTATAVAWAALAAVSASAQSGPDDASPSSLVVRARAAEAHAQPARALALYEQARAAAPTSRLAGVAERRIAWLKARSEGDFEPLSELLRFRQTAPVTAGATAQLERRLAAFPAGRVRREARLAVGQAWLQLGRPHRAEKAFRALLGEPGLSVSDRQLAVIGVARAVDAQGDPGRAARWLEAHGGSTVVLLRRHYASSSRARVGRWVAMGLLAVCLVAMVLAAGLRWLDPRRFVRALRLRRMLVGAYVLLVPLVLAYAFAAVTLDTFSRLAVGLGAVLAVTWAASDGLVARGPTRGRRVAVAGASVVAHLAVAYLVLVAAGLPLSFTP